MTHHILFTTEEIRAMVEKLANDLDSAGKPSYVALTVLKGAAVFSSDLVRAMKTPTELEYVTASSYLTDFTPGDSVEIQGPPINLTGKHLLIVEDIIDTGRTLEHLHQRSFQQRPASITTVTLVNKSGRRKIGFEPDHYGFTITDEHIYGYGLDWNQAYRDLPYIAIANHTSGSG